MRGSLVLGYRQHSCGNTLQGTPRERVVELDAEQARPTSPRHRPLRTWSHRGSRARVRCRVPRPGSLPVRLVRCGLRSSGAQGKGASRVRSEIKVAPCSTSCCTARPVRRGKTNQEGETRDVRFVKGGVEDGGGCGSKAAARAAGVEHVTRRQPGPAEHVTAHSVAAARSPRRAPAASAFPLDSDRVAAGQPRAQRRWSWNDGGKCRATARGCRWPLPASRHGSRRLRGAEGEHPRRGQARPPDEASTGRAA